MKISGRFGLALLSAAALAAGCGPDQQLEPCNIATETCQEDIYYALLRLRGDGYDALADVPPIKTITRDAYCDALFDSLPDEPPPMDEEEEEEEEPKVVPWDFALQVLGLVTKEQSSGQSSANDQCSTVAAYYASNERQVTVIDSGGQPGETDEKRAQREFNETALLAHELVHALQDRELSGASFDGTTDSNLTARALTEGEATFYQRLTEQEMLDSDATNIDWDGYYGGWVADSRWRLSGAKSPFHGVRWFIYPLGAHYLTDAWLDGGNAAVRHAYAHPRGFMAQFMAGYGNEAPVLEPALDCAIQGPSATYKRVGLDRFGALHVYAFLQRAQVPDDEAWALASHWGDDRIHVFFDEAAQIALVSWAMRFGSEAEAERAHELLVLDPLARAELRGRDVVVTAGNDEEVAAEWNGAMDCEPSP